MFFQTPKPPIIVKLIEPPSKDPTGLADLLITALGLSGALTLLAVLCGVVLGAVMFWIRSRDLANELSTTEDTVDTEEQS